MGGKLAGRRIFITGVSRGIGRATARLFLEEGAEVMGVARDREQLAAARDEMEARAPGRFAAFAVDLLDPEAATHVFQVLAVRWGALDVLFSNAAIMPQGPSDFAGESAGTLEATLAANLVSPFRVSQALLPLLRRGREPRIIHVTSGAGRYSALGDPGIASYRLSKWALNGLTRMQAHHLRGKIAVNALDPGWVKTRLGGPRAPGEPEDSAREALALLMEPFTITGKLFKDGHEIEY